MLNEAERMIREFLVDAATARFARDSRDDQVHMIVNNREYAVGNVAMAFPLSSRTRMISVRNREGQEIGILDDLSRLDDASRAIVDMEMEKAYFLPKVSDVFDVREELSIVTFKVETDRGPRTFQVRNVRQNIRKIGYVRFVIRDVDGNRYEIPDFNALSPRVQRMMEEYF